MSTLEESIGLLSVLSGIEDLRATTPLSKLDSLTVVEWMFTMEDELNLEVDMDKIDELGPEDTLETVVAALVQS